MGRGEHRSGWALLPSQLPCQLRLVFAILVGLAVRGGANLLNAFHEHIRPFIQRRFVNILRGRGAQSLHLLLIHQVEARHPEDRFHRVTIEMRKTLDHEILRLFQDLFVAAQRRPQLAIPRVHENSLWLICVENATRIGAEEIEATALLAEGRAEVMHINHGLSTNSGLARHSRFPFGTYEPVLLPKRVVVADQAQGYPEGSTL